MTHLSKVTLHLQARRSQLMKDLPREYHLFHRLIIRVNLKIVKKENLRRSQRLTGTMCRQVTINFCIHQTIGKRWNSKDNLKKVNLTVNKKKNKPVPVLNLMKTGMFGDWLIIDRILTMKIRDFWQRFQILNFENIWIIDWSTCRAFCLMNTGMFLEIDWRNSSDSDNENWPFFR